VDLIPDVAHELAGVDWVEHGALDLLAPPEIACLAPRDGDPELVSRLRDGTSARLGVSAIAEHLDGAIHRCILDGCGVVLVLCTGRVQHSPAPVPVLHAEELAHEQMARLVREGRLGVLCPMPGQLDDITARWAARLGRPIVAAAVDPYTATLDKIAAAGRAVAERGAEQVFLDCIGYTEQHRSAIEHSGPPTHTARSLAVRGAMTVLRDRARLGAAVEPRAEVVRRLPAV
jgi:protein AroM